MNANTQIAVFVICSLGIVLWIVYWFLLSTRFFAFIVTYILYFWKFRNKNAYLSIGALSIAPLGGKIFFKDVKYVGKNGFIRIIDGYIVISWWIIKKTFFKNTKQESRVTIHLNGLEGVLYNTTKYVEIEKSKNTKNQQNVNMGNNNQDQHHHHHATKVVMKKPIDGIQRFFKWARSVGIEISSGHIVFGNDSLPTIAVVGFKKLIALVKLNKPKSEFDPYRFELDVQMEDQNLCFRKTPNYKEHIDHYLLRTMQYENDYFSTAKAHFQRIFKDSKFYFFEEHHEENLGDFQNPYKNVKIPYTHKFPSDYEKNKEVIGDESIVYRCKSVRFTYYYDKPGVVLPTEPNEIPPESPETGIEIYFDSFEEGSIIYGPWGDHQRSIIQYFFFPRSFEDMPINSKEPGTLRQYETFDIMIHFKRDATWILPFTRSPRTPAEKENLKGCQENVKLKFKRGSHISWRAAMTAPDSSGYSTNIEMLFKEMAWVTSNTNASLVEAKESNWKFKLQNEIQWNGLADWDMSFTFKDCNLFYIAEHIPFMQDFIRDLSNYPNKTPPSIKEFYPSKQKYKFIFLDANIMMNINNYNIIEKHNDRSCNTFFHIDTPIFEFSLSFPFLTYDPIFSETNFVINIEKDDKRHPFLEIMFPHSHPFHKILQNEKHKFLSGDRLTINGKYLSHYKVCADNLDQCTLDINVENMSAEFFGYDVSYFLGWYYNYFTVQKVWMGKEEFILNGHKNDKHKQISTLQWTDLDGYSLPYNDMELSLRLKVKGGRGAIPLNLYTLKENCGYVFGEDLTLEIRYVSRYIEIMLNVGPVMLELPCSEDENKLRPSSRTCVGIDGFTFWGTQYMGPPPDYNYYKLVIKVILGDITGQLVPSQLGYLLVFLQNLARQWKLAYPPSEFDNVEPQYFDRVLPLDEAYKNKWTNINFSTGNINVIVTGHYGCIHCRVEDGIAFMTDSCNDRETNSRSLLEIPKIGIKFLQKREAYLKTSEGDWIEVAAVNDIGVRLRIEDVLPTVKQDFEEQQKYLEDQSINDPYAQYDSLSENINEGENLVRGDINVDDIIVVDLPHYNSTEAFSPTTATDTQTDVTDKDSFQDGQSDFQDAKSEMSQQSEEDVIIEDVVLNDIGKLHNSKRHSVSVPSFLNYEKTENKINSTFQQTEQEESDIEDDEDDDEILNDAIFFYKDKRTGWRQHVSLSRYHKYLNYYDIEQEEKVFSIRKFNHKNILTAENRMGLYSPFPELYLHHIPTSGKIFQNGFRKDLSPMNKDQSKNFTSSSQQYKKIPKLEDLLPDEEESNTSLKRIHLEFLHEIDVLVTPNFTIVLQEILKSILLPFNNLIDAIDAIERRLDIQMHESLSQQEKPGQEKKEPDWRFSRITFSCSLNSAKLSAIQAVIPPKVFKKSQILGTNTSCLMKLFLSGFFCATSVRFENTWKDEDGIWKKSSELNSVDASIKLKSVKLLGQLLNKRVKVYSGISASNMSEQIQDIDFLRTRPIILFGSLSELKCKGKFIERQMERQGRFILKCADGLKLHMMEELPAVMFSCIDLWKFSILEIVNVYKDANYCKELYELVLLAGVSTLDEANFKKTEETKATSIELDSSKQFAMDFSIIPQNDAIIDLRSAVKNLSANEASELKRMFASVDLDPSTISVKELKKSVVFNYYSLVEGDVTTTSPKPKISLDPNSATSFFNKKTRADLFFHVGLISFCVYAYNTNTKNLTQSCARLKDLSLRGKVEHGLVMERRTVSSANTEGNLSWSFKKFIPTKKLSMRMKKKREIYLIFSANLKSVSIDLHPESVSLVSSVLGIIYIIKSREKNSDTHQETSNEPREHTSHYRSKTVDSNFSGNKVDILTGNERKRGSTEKGSSIDIPKSNRSSFIFKEPKLKTHFYIFANNLVERIEARAWLDENNYAELSFDRVSIVFNKPKKIDDINMAISSKLYPTEADPNKEYNLKLFHSGVLSISKIKFQYNFATDERLSPQHIPLIDASLSGANVNEFWFSCNEKNNCHVIVNFKNLTVNIPYTDIWAGASLQFKKFVKIWYDEFSQVVPELSKSAKYLTNENGGSNSKSPRDKDIKNIFQIPVINVTFDLNQIVCNFMVLPNLQMRYTIQRIIVSYNYASSMQSTFRLHLHSSHLFFKTNLSEEFMIGSSMWQSQEKGFNSFPKSQTFKKQFILPAVLVSGVINSNMEDEKLLSRSIETSVAVEYIENIITSEILNHILYLQTTMMKEINNIVEGLTNAVGDQDIKGKIKSEFPKAQASVSSLKLNYTIKLLLEGIHITALGASTAVVLDTGITHAIFKSNTEDNIKNINFHVSLKNTSAQMIDTYNLKFSSKREFNDKYSSTKDCYKWATFVTNVQLNNKNNNKETTEQNKKITSTNKFSIEVKDTHLYIRPGFIDQAIVMMKDYTEAFKNLRNRVKQNKEHLQSAAIASLVKTGEQYYSYYSKQIVETVTKDPGQFITSGDIKVLNTTLSLPIGDNSYYGFLANQTTLFTPTMSIQAVVDSIELKNITKSDDKVTETLDPLMKTVNNNIETSSRQRAVCKVSTICIYTEELFLKHGQSIAIPSVINFASARNRIRVEKGVLNLEVLTTPQLLRGHCEVNINGPEIHAHSSFITSILHLQNDWFNSNRSLYTDGIQLSSQKATTDSNVVATTLKRVMNFTCKATIEPGTINLHHTLQTPDPLLRAMRISKRGEPGVAAIATLPSAEVEILHLSPAVQTKTSNNRSNTHLQVNIHWDGASFSPQVVLFAKQLLFTYQVYAETKKNRRKTKYHNDSTQNTIKPITWMNLLKSVIMIQRVYRGYLIRKMLKEKKNDNSKQLTPRQNEKNQQKKTKNESDISLQTDTFSFLCRIDPFKISVTCTPISDVITSFEFSEPFDLLFTRAYRSVKSGEVKGNALYNTIFLSAPEVLVRCYHTLSPSDFARLKILGIMGNLGAGYGTFLRSDDASVQCGTITFEKILIEGNLPQLNEFFIIFTLFMDKIEEADNALKLEKKKFKTMDKQEEKQTPKSGKSKKKFIEEINLDATSSRFGQIFIKEVQIDSDLGVAIGRQCIKLKSVNLLLRDRGRFENHSIRDPLHTGAYINSVSVNLSGRLQGGFSMNGVAIGLTRHFRVADKNPVYKGVSDICVRVLPINLELEYNTDKILSLSTGEIVAKFRDKFDTADGKLYHVQSAFICEKAITRLSRQTVPSFIKIAMRLKDKIHERRQVALETIRSSLTFRGSSILKTQESESELPTYIKSLKVKSPTEQLLSLIPIGDATILGKNLYVFLYDKYDYGTNQEVVPIGEWLEFSVGNYRLNLARTTNTEQKEVVRLLSLFLAKINVDRMMKKTRSNILQVPGALLEMESTQQNESDVIDYSFISKFPEAIKVTTNLSEYNFFRNIIELYSGEIDKELKSYHPPTSTSVLSSTTTGNAERSLGDNNEGKQNSKKLNLKPERKFLGKVDLNPKLNVLGDMTPKVETVLGWLGIKDKNVIPRATHDFITDTLEAILVACYNSSQILDNVFEEK